MIKDKKINISRHGTFISKIKVDSEIILKSLRKEIEISLTSTKYTKEDINILTQINLILKDLNQIDLSYINNDNDDISKFISDQEIIWLSKRKKELWVPYIIYRYKFKTYPKLNKLSKFPPYLLIEPTSVCNIRCVMCFQVDKSFSSNKNFMGFMSIEVFKKIIEEAVHEGCHAVTLASRGEPTLHKQFGKLLEILKEAKFLDLKLNTNATALDEKKIHNILSAEFSEVVFSVDAGTKETYEKIRVLGNFDKVVNNIKMFNDIKKKYYPNSPTITRIAGVKVNDEQDLLQMAQFWSQYVDEVSIKSASPRWDTYNNKINNEIKPCLNLWYRMYIWYDGTVNPCDFDYKSYLQVGNINKDSISKIWMNEKYKTLRLNHLEKKRKQHIPCDRCPITS